MKLIGVDYENFKHHTHYLAMLEGERWKFEGVFHYARRWSLCHSYYCVTIKHCRSGVVLYWKRRDI